ncbi:MAG: porin family protein [Litorimonas sp.]
MRNTAKLLPVLLLGSALGGCSMAGTGDYFADEYAHTQQTQMPHYWGEPSGCVPTACEVSHPTAPAHVDTHPYGGQPTIPDAHAYGHSAQGYHGGQSHHQTGYVPAYVNSHGGHGKGLRQAYTYGTLGATMYDIDSDLYGVQGRLGWQSKSFFGAEVEGSVGFNDDEASVDFGTGLVTAESGIDTQIAGFGVARFPLSERLNVLGRVGYHNTEFSAEFDDGTTVLEQEFSTDGIAYGLGAEYAIGRRTSLRADYTRYDFDGADADAVSLAIAQKF